LPAELMDVQFAAGREPCGTPVGIRERLNGRVGKLVDEGRGEVIRRARLIQRIDQLLQCDVRDRAEQVGQRRAQGPQRTDDFLALPQSARPAHGHDNDFLAVQVLRQEGRGRGGRQVDQRGELVGGTGNRVPPAGQYLGSLLSGVEDGTA
jgi:hypothetical protein